MPPNDQTPADTPAVQFEEQKHGWPAVKYYREDNPRLVAWAMRHSKGFIEDEKQATVVLLVFAGLIFLASIIIFMRAL